MDIPALEATVRNLEHSMGVFTWWLLGSTFFVALGLVLEYWHPVSEFIDELKWPMSTFRWPKFMEIVGGILVTIGVLGEFGFTLEVFVLEGRLEKANHDIRDALTARLGEADTKAKEAVTDSSTAIAQAKDALSKAGAAEASLGKAETESKEAQSAASNALNLATGARQEAKSFGEDIAKLKRQLAWRSVTPECKIEIANKLGHSRPQKLDFFMYPSDPEINLTAEQIAKALPPSWQFAVFSPLTGNVAGMAVEYDPNDTEASHAALALTSALQSEPCELVGKVIGPFSSLPTLPKDLPAMLSAGNAQVGANIRLTIGKK
jgi:hypothetical protein